MSPFLLEGHIARATVEFPGTAAVLLQLDVGRVADHDVEAFGYSEHPFGVEPCGARILVIGVPVGDGLGVVVFES